MPPTTRLIAISLSIAVCLGGCYTTRVETRNGSFDPRAGFTDSDRQLFLLWGMIRLSHAATCREGELLTAAESEMGGVDILIQIGIATAVAGTIIAGCKDKDAACISGASSASSLATGLLGTRTTHFQCIPGAAPTKPTAHRAPPPDSEEEQPRAPPPAAPTKRKK